MNFSLYDKPSSVKLPNRSWSASEPKPCSARITLPWSADTIARKGSRTGFLRWEHDTEETVLRCAGSGWWECEKRVCNLSVALHESFNIFSGSKKKMWETRSFSFFGFNFNNKRFESVASVLSDGSEVNKEGKPTTKTFLVCHLLVSEFTLLPSLANCQRRD